MRIEYRAPFEGPRTEENPKGLSIRAGDKRTVEDGEGLRLVDRDLAYRLDDDDERIHEGLEPKPAPAPVAEPGPFDLATFGDAMAEGLVALHKSAGAGADAKLSAGVELTEDELTAADAAEVARVAEEQRMQLQQAREQTTNPPPPAAPPPPREKAVRQPPEKRVAK